MSTCARCATLFSRATPRLIDIRYGNMVTPELRRFYCPGCAEAIYRARTVLFRSGNSTAAKAATILGRATITRTRIPGVFTYKSTATTTATATASIFYIVTPDSCSCPAGMHGVLCSHRVAATILNTEEEAA